jgi:penicillin-binding protein, 1A family
MSKSQNSHRKIVYSTILLILSLFLLIIGMVLIAIVFTFPRLPSLQRVTHYEPSLPMKVYSRDNVLIGEYGIEKRTFTKIEDFPDILKYAVLAAEDRKFYRHKGVDVTGIARAFFANLVAGGVEQGASTITQQVAKNFFLSNERTFRRKFYEILLALKIEMNLSKDKILELYFNQIYLGLRSYGFAAASIAYFNKPVKELDVAEAAMLAGLPKAPSTFNPVTNPRRAKSRQLYVLKNMLKEGWITPDIYKQAAQEQLVFNRQKIEENVDENSLYVAEMVRRQLHDRYGDAIYRSGFRVYTTVTVKQQKAATLALQKTLLKNSPKGVFRGPEATYPLNKAKYNIKDIALSYLANHHTVQQQIPAIVIKASHDRLKLLAESRKDPIVLTGAKLNFVANFINNLSKGSKAVKVGSILRLYYSKGSWSITQAPELEGGIVSLDPRTGAIKAIVGGFNFFAQQFNRAIQSIRQPGSTFKPFVYSAAIEKGYTPGTIVNDAPVKFGRYSPKNSGGSYAGPITIREALYRSRNVVAVKVLHAIGVDYARSYVQRFGFPAKNIPKDLTMVLGSGQATPLQMARGYSVFANGGYLIEPYIIDRIYNDKGQLIARTQPLVAGISAPRTIDPKNAFIMYKMLQDVIQYGTGRAALALGRSDIAGKTGTTNNQKDAWFVGFNTKLVTAVYIGFDHPKSMGSMGYGGRVALPVWMDYMRVALRGIPIQVPQPPKNVINNKGYYSISGKPTIDNDSSDDSRSSNLDTSSKSQVKDSTANSQSNSLDSLF